MAPLTVLALVSLELRRAAAGRLVARVDRAVAPVHAVVLAGLAVTVRPREAFGAPAGWSTWGDRYVRDEASHLDSSELFKIPFSDNSC